MSTKLNATRLRLLNEVLYALYDELSGSISFQQVVEALTRVVPALSFSAVEIRSNPKRFITRAQRNWDAQFSAKISRLGHKHPIVQALQKEFHPVLRLSDLCTLRQFKQTEVYDEVYKNVSGFRDHAGMMTRLPGCQVGLSFNRDTTFQDEDVLLLELLHPHVERILGRAIQYSEMDTRLSLTPREREVLHWLAEGKRDQEVAVILGMSPRTVEHHVRVILRKLGVETRTAAAAASWRARTAAGWGTPSPPTSRPTQD